MSNNECQKQTVRRVTLEEGSIEYHEYGSHEAPPILFVHGVLSNHQLWEQVALRLFHQYRCIVPILPLGAHSIPMSPGTDLSPEGMISLIVKFMDVLHLDRVTIVGNNSGGALCQMMVARHPQRIERLVLTSCDAYSNWLPLLFKYLEFSAFIPGMLWVLAQTMRLHFIRKMPFAFGWLCKRMPVDISDALIRPLVKSSGVRRDLAKFLRGVSPRLTQDAAKHFASFSAPVLIAWSREDRFFPLEHARRLRSDFPNARLSLIDDSYTFSGIDNSYQLAVYIESFLKETAIQTLRARQQQTKLF